VLLDVNHVVRILRVVLPQVLQHLELYLSLHCKSRACVCTVVGTSQHGRFQP
jgi:hypothetical protein